jgi:hypothetical protein
MATQRRHYQNNTGVEIRTKEDFERVIENARLILDVEILVGVPRETADRPKGLDEQDDEAINNAVLAYIHDQGAPEAHIPQREFMRPGVESVREEAVRKLGVAMRVALRGDAVKAEMAMLQVGLVVQSGILNFIDAGIPPPLADLTLMKRIARGRGHKGSLREMDRRRSGLAPSTVYAKPLIDSGEMRKSIKFVLRSRRRRR